MKKTLAIVLALVMVLCMVPAMSAATFTTKTVADKNYDIKVMSVGKTTGATGTASQANSVTFKYNFEEEDADVTGRFTEDTKMALVVLEKFDGSLIGSDVEITSVTIDGKELSSSVAGVGYNKNDGSLAFPIELTKSGYTDTYLVQVTGKKGDAIITETAKVSVKLVNTAEYKDAKTAYITNVTTDTKTLSAYIVGDKIYLDYVNKKDDSKVTFTFGDENKKAFSVITYVNENAAFDFVGVSEMKLDKYSAAEYVVIGTDGMKKLSFNLETKNALYETKEYTLKIRENIKPEDPKGIYFAETSKTIAMGETYAPVVMGVKTGKVVDAELVLGKMTDAQVIDIVDNKVVGTREGIAYITATYTVPGSSTKYESSSMKITVTLPGESIPAVGTEATVYYVTCRNLNVRAGAGTSYKKAGMVHRGDAVKVVEIKNGWAKLADNTYVCAKYIAK